MARNSLKENKKKDFKLYNFFNKNFLDNINLKYDIVIINLIFTKINNYFE